MLEIKKFRELKDNEINLIIDAHYNHWFNYNPKMLKENTIYKFSKLYTQNDLPFGIALLDDNNIVGFCVLKLENSKKYPYIYPWISDLMILKKVRRKGYGKLLISCAEQLLKDLGYKTAYLWTDQAPDFYRKLGFKYKQIVEKNEGGFVQLFYKKI